MKTDININELIDAFRAQEQERLDNKRAKQQALADAEAQRGQIALHHLQAVWPKFVEIFQHIPYPAIYGQPRIEQLPQAGGSQAWCSFNALVEGSTLEVRIGVDVSAETGRIQYRLYYPSTRRSQDRLGNIFPMFVENPADILVELAKYVGTTRAK